MMALNTSINFLRPDFLSSYRDLFKDTYNVASLQSKFIFKVIPRLKTRIKDDEKFIEELIAPFLDLHCSSANCSPANCSPAKDLDSSGQLSILEKDFFINKEYIKSIYAAFATVDIEKVLTFMENYSMMVIYLDHLCRYNEINDRLILHQLYLSLLDAVDPARETSDYYKYFPNSSHKLRNTEKNCVKHFVDLCRNQIKDIPSYEMVKEYIKKYVYIKKDYFIYKHSHNEKDYKLSNWAGNYNYIKHYPELFPWEFQAAAYSDLGLYALLASAFDPSLSTETIANIDKAYFPWINGLQILLMNYINLYQNIFVNDHNFSSYYENLKQYEERLEFFFRQSLKVCSELNLNNVYKSIHKSIIKLILAVYLSDPRAHTGLKKIASRNLSVVAGPVSLMLQKTIMSLVLTSKYQCTYPY